MLFANTHKANAPWGGWAGVFGTNPIAFAVLRAGKDPLIDFNSLGRTQRLGDGDPTFDG